MRLIDKVTLITGGSSGIGKATALLFAREGASVVVADINDEGARQTTEEIRKQGFEASFVYADVSKADDCRIMVEHTEAKFGKLNILFNNAGIMDSRDGNAEATEEATWDHTMNINAKGVFLGCTQCPVLRWTGQRGDGRCLPRHPSRRPQCPGPRASGQPRAR